MTVYFIQSDKFVKIGYSSRPMQRINALQTANPKPIHILFLMPGSPATEKELHSVFTPYHQLNEWYKLEGDLLDFSNAASCIFSEYTSQFETNENYQDEQDWEYWKARALQAESRNAKATDTTSQMNKLPSDFRLLTSEQKDVVNGLTSGELAEMAAISDRTARRWKEKVAANGYHK